MSKAIAILGCGWLGLPLAEHFISLKYLVNGSTTDKGKLSTLKKAGVNPFLVQVNESEIEGDIQGFLNHMDVLVVNIPPKLRKPPFEDYTAKIALLIRHLENSSISKVVFVSSTSVYGEVEGIVTEATKPKPTTESGKQLLASENLLLKSRAFKTTIIRFGGLIGPNRHPIHHLSGKKDLSNGDELVNLIHLQDCIRLIHNVMEHSLENPIVNGVYPYHPTKREFYKEAAKKRGLPPPKYSKENVKTIKKAVKSNIFLTKYKWPITT